MRVRPNPMVHHPCGLCHQQPSTPGSTAQMTAAGILRAHWVNRHTLDGPKLSPTSTTNSLPTLQIIDTIECCRSLRFFDPWVCLRDSRGLSPPPPSCGPCMSWQGHTRLPTRLRHNPASWLESACSECLPNPWNRLTTGRPMRCSHLGPTSVPFCRAITTTPA